MRQHEHSRCAICSTRVEWPFCEVVERETGWTVPVCPTCAEEGMEFGEVRVPVAARVPVRAA